MEKKKEIRVSDSFQLIDHLSVVKRRDDKIIGFSESERQGYTAAADQGADGALTWTLTGGSPQGEGDTLTACSILIRALNASGASWSQPTSGSEPADCQAVDSKDPKRCINIQIVRAITSQSIWKDMNKLGPAKQINLSKDDLAAEVMSAIKVKTTKIPPTLRSDIVLGLDANRIPVLLMDDIVSHLRSILIPDISTLGFQAVWLIGPTADLTVRLDSA